MRDWAIAIASQLLLARGLCPLDWASNSGALACDTPPITSCKSVSVSRMVACLAMPPGTQVTAALISRFAARNRPSSCPPLSSLRPPESWSTNPEKPAVTPRRVLVQLLIVSLPLANLNPQIPSPHPQPRAIKNTSGQPREPTHSVRDPQPAHHVPQPPSSPVSEQTATPTALHSQAAMPIPIVRPQPTNAPSRGADQPGA